MNWNTVGFPNMDVACAISNEISAQSGVLPRPYQVEGIGRCVTNNLLLSFQMGLGKTATACAGTRWSDNVMYVVPKSARSVWLKDIQRFGGRDSVIELRGKLSLKAHRLLLEGGRVAAETELPIGTPYAGEPLLVTHACVGSWASTRPDVVLRSSKMSSAPIQLPDTFGALVIDESHRFGSKDSKRSMGVGHLAKHSLRTILLSGTPDMGGAQRLWWQLHMLAPAIFDDYIVFIKRYAGAKETEWGLKPTVGTNLEELNHHMLPWTLSYRQSEVADYLPKHTRDRVVIPLTGPEARRVGVAINSARKALRARSEVERAPGTFFLPGEVVEARLACADVKVSTAAPLADEIVASGERLVIWCWHRAICQKLSKAISAKTYIVHGGTTDDMVNRYIEEWARSEPSILIATIGKLGEGEDRLVAACWQMFVEIDWLPQSVLQAEHRLLRLSQKRPVNTRFLQLDIEFEKSLMDRVLERADESDALFGGESGLDIGELFGIPRTGSMDGALARLSERLT